MTHESFPEGALGSAWVSRMFAEWDRVLQALSTFLPQRGTQCGDQLLYS